jgi:hypothetical protein
VNSFHHQPEAQHHSPAVNAGRPITPSYPPTTTEKADIAGYLKPANTGSATATKTSAALRAPKLRWADRAADRPVMQHQLVSAHVDKDLPLVHPALFVGWAEITTREGLPSSVATKERFPSLKLNRVALAG